MEEAGMFQREDEGDWQAYHYQISARVPHITFKDKNMSQEVETTGRLFFFKSKRTSNKTPLR